MSIRPMILAALMVYGWTATSALATTYVVTRFDDPVPTACTSTNCSLRAAVLTANAHAGSDIVQLKAGAYDLKLTTTASPLGGALTVSDRVTISGAGSTHTTIRQLATYRVFTVQSTIVSLSGLAIGEGNVQGTTSAGGCIYSDGGNLTLTDVVVADCTAGGTGGGIYMAGGQVTLDNSKIEYNQAPNGAAVAMGGAGPHLTLRNRSYLLRNTAGCCGGAVYANAATGGSAVEMSADSVVTENGASAGGAFYVARFKGLSVALSNADLATPGALAHVQDNNGFNGGALYSEGAVNVSRVLFAGNSATSGGAFYFTNLGVCPSSSVANSRFTGNVAAGDGGAVWGSDGQLLATNVTFDGNQAAGHGGAIWYRSGDYLIPGACQFAEVGLTNASITGNSATGGGGVSIANGSDQGHAMSGYALLSNVFSTFLGNHASALPRSSDVEVDNQQTPQYGSQTTSANAMYSTSSIYGGSCSYLLDPGQFPYGAEYSYGGNFDVDGSCLPNAMASDHPGTSPASLALSFGNFGGPIPVVGTVSATSPALNAGITQYCPATDARGAPRVPGSCDSGAFEFGAVVP